MAQITARGLLAGRGRARSFADTLEGEAAERHRLVLELETLLRPPLKPPVLPAVSAPAVHAPEPQPGPVHVPAIRVELVTAADLID